MRRPMSEGEAINLLGFVMVAAGFLVIAWFFGDALAHWRVLRDALEGRP